MKTLSKKLITTFAAFTTLLSVSSVSFASAMPGNVTNFADTCNSSGCNLISFYLVPIVNLLSGLVGIVVVISIIIGGIQFSSSAGDPQQASKAKSRIVNSLLALLAFFFLYAVLQFLIPGGFLNGK
jgi:hypothetical protein